MIRTTIIAPIVRSVRTSFDPLAVHALLAFAAWTAIVCTGSTGAKADEVIAPEKPTAEQATFFETKVRPLLAQSCFECHGDEEQEGGLRLDSLENILNGGESGPAIVRSNPTASLLIKAVTHVDPALEMPPDEKLTGDQIQVLEKWVSMGAPWPGVDKVTIRSRAASHVITNEDRAFWSFQPLAKTGPAASDDAWIRTPIDGFILSQLTQHRIQPNEQADRRTLIRRAYFDLLGLPPTPEEVNAFVADADPKAYDKLIDRLLDSPHYGERWARHWLDVARFAESHGYEQDYDRPHAYHYRDFLIKSLNDDIPYDQFVRWQIAGDELAPEDPLAMMATGFLGGGAFPTQLTEAEFESARYDELDDIVSTVGSAFLGLTIGCARCHEHKYDPISMLDYYGLASTFTTTIRSEIDLDLSAAETTFADSDSQTTKVQVSSEGFPHTKHHADDRGFPHFYPETHLLTRGDVKQKQDVMDPGFLRILMSPGKQASDWKIEPPEAWTRTSFRRAGLAHWLTDAQDGAGGLAARVIVNRLWQHHLGRGIVASPNDFGFQGDRPTHPELLDWLATDLIKHGWRLKRIHKLIMTSAVYMQSASNVDGRLSQASNNSETITQSRQKVDSENRLYWRWTRRRLEGEAIRDSMLQVGGILDTTMYGPGTLDESMRRRSIYFFIKRSKLIPTMMLFDWPEHLVSIGRRSSTTIAPQALALINGPQTRASADGLAGRVADLPVDQAIVRAYELALGRTPQEQELQIATTFIAHQMQSYGQETAKQLALADYCQALLCSNEFAYLD